jgi:hypothetical protein
MHVVTSCRGLEATGRFAARSQGARRLVRMSTLWHNCRRCQGGETAIQDLQAGLSVDKCPLSAIVRLQAQAVKGCGEAAWRACVSGCVVAITGDNSAEANYVTASAGATIQVTAATSCQDLPAWVQTALQAYTHTLSLEYRSVKAQLFMTTRNPAYITGVPTESHWKWSGYYPSNLEYYIKLSDSSQQAKIETHFLPLTRSLRAASHATGRETRAATKARILSAMCLRRAILAGIQDWSESLELIRDAQTGR